MLEGLLLPAIGFILGTGGVASVLGWLIARKKAPAETDSIVVQSAEVAALTLQKSLAAETARADRLQAEVERKDRRIVALETRLDAVQKTVDDLRRELELLRSDS